VNANCAEQTQVSTITHRGANLCNPGAPTWRLDEVSHEPNTIRRQVCMNAHTNARTRSRAWHLRPVKAIDFQAGTSAAAQADKAFIWPRSDNSSTSTSVWSRTPINF